MATQKMELAVIRERAAVLGHTVSIRKNAYGEYEARCKANGERFAPIYFADSFYDALDTLNFMLDKVEHEQRERGKVREQEREYERQAKRRQIADAFYNLSNLLRTVDCTIGWDEQTNVVTFTSPKTGTHSLNMNCRPVGDLYAHGMGFAEQQTHVKA